MLNVLNLLKTRATEVSITQIVHLANVSLSLIKTRTKNMIINLQTSQFSPHGSKRKDS